MPPRLNKKVFVAMSGGVDSSVSAALLKKAGYDVTGVFIKVWQPDWLDCDWKEDRRDAMRVAALLDIPFSTFNLEKEYKREVVDYMIREYKAGRTPNPDVMCNKAIKFGSFFRKARLLGADYIATGHYARIKELGIKNKELRRFELWEGKDKNKDQSYFLWGLTQKELARTLFPVGGFKKDQVRKLAKQFRLPNAEKKDSQGLCFIGKIEMKEFLKNFLAPKKGKVLNEKGEIIGYHDGAHFFTIGERHGFIINRKTPKDKPYYVVNKDVKRNILTVSDERSGNEFFFDGRTRRESPPWQADREASVGLRRKKLIAAQAHCCISKVNWISKKPIPTKSYTCRIRYRQEKQKCRIDRRGKNYAVIFSTPQPTLASGQSLVLYDGERCLGGGVIE